MKKLLLLIVALVLLGVLIVVYIPFTPSQTTVGSDRDTHNCIASAGYTFSVVRNDCIRVWEEGTALMPTVQIEEPVLAAYVVRSANWKEAEIFLPGQENSIILTLQDNTPVTTWTGPQGNWVLTYDKEQGWKLSLDGELLYTGNEQ
ncbi:MAG: hypothetical protein IJ876_02475 [Elusimicrobiaceae bacterium]|nr:hypothetical protein [Elusimicrobiaceae bacterium]